VALLDGMLGVVSALRLGVTASVASCVVPPVVSVAVSVGSGAVWVAD
jgi:hypothetical protein